MSKIQTYIIGLVIFIVATGGGFYCGMKYNQSKGSFNQPAFAGQRQGGQFAQGARTGGNNATRASAGFVNGSIISQDAKSITVKSQDGGSKIIFLADSTQITKSATGTIEDLNKDVNVLANGTTNTDGSITATFIQIRPQGMNENRPMGTVPVDIKQPVQ